MKKWFTLLVVAAFACNALNAQFAVKAQPAHRIAFERYTLGNGLKVILHQDKTAPVVAVTALYHVGSKNEDTARTGFAHFFEHLLFEGSDNIKRGEYSRYVSNAGGALNANTSQDRTFYYELLPSNQLELGMWLESERMMHAKIEQVGVNTQREVVKEEKRQRIDNRPYGTMMTELYKRAGKGTPYEWAPIGSMAHLNAAKLEEFINFYKTYYVPNNCVLSIAGDIDIAKTKQLINDYFAPITRGKKKIVRPVVKNEMLGGEVRDVIPDNVQLPQVVEAYRSPKQGTDEYYAFEMLSQALSGGASARLSKKLVDEKEIALFAGSFPAAAEDAGMFVTLARAVAGVKAEDLEASMDSVVESMKTGLITEREFQKVKNQVETDFVTSNASMAGIAESLANYEVYFGDANLINTELGRYNKVTREDILAVAKKYLNKDNRVVLYYMPKSKKA